MPGSINVLGFLGAVLYKALDYNGSLSIKRATEELKNKYGKKYNRSQFAKDIYGLRRSGYIVLAHQNGQDSIHLTIKAHLKIIEKKLKLFEKDSSFRFVSFDIPEKLSSQRDKFRRAIKRMGFRQVQRSLWVSDRNLGELVDMAAEEFHVGEYVVYLVVEKTNIDPIIRALLHPRKKVHKTSTQ